MVEKVWCCTSPGAKVRKGGLFGFFFGGRGSHCMGGLIVVADGIRMSVNATAGKFPSQHSHRHVCCDDLIVNLSKCIAAKALDSRFLEGQNLLILDSQTIGFPSVTSLGLPGGLFSVAVYRSIGDCFLCGQKVAGTRCPVMPGATTSGADATPNGNAKSRDHNQGNQDKKYTVEQKAAVIRVRRCSVTAFYEILGLEKSCSDAEVKKAYRKLSLLTHPDKNGYEGADEAFKRES